MTFDPIFTMAMTTLCSTFAFALYELNQVRNQPKAQPVRAEARRERARRR
jgi:hypothetical protein